MGQSGADDNSLELVRKVAEYFVDLVFEAFA
jgi:hypothetical protein